MNGLELLRGLFLRKFVSESLLERYRFCRLPPTPKDRIGLKHDSRRSADATLKILNSQTALHNKHSVGPRLSYSP